MWARAGGVPAHPDNAYRLLRDQGQLALVFPEGTKGPSKTYTDRYQLRRFGRGGFVEIAMRAGVPVVPIAVVGAEESMPIVFRLPRLAKAHRRALLPGHRQHARLRAPRARSSPSRPSSSCGSSTRSHFDVPPDQERYSKSRVMEEAETHPHRPAGDPLRNAARAPQRLVRLTGPMGRRVLVTGLDTFWGGRMAQALEADPEVEMILGHGDPRSPSVPLERTEFVRADQTYSILSAASCGPPRSTRSSTPSWWSTRPGAPAGPCTRSTSSGP